MKEVTKTKLNDWSHGWLSVKRKELDELGIADDITPYSYQRGQSVYLEEDYDMITYLRAQERRGVNVNIKYGKRCYKNSPVRSYKSYTTRV